MTSTAFPSTNGGFDIGRAGGAIDRTPADPSGVGVFASAPMGLFEPKRPRPGAKNQPTTGGPDSIERKAPLLCTAVLCPPAAMTAAKSSYLATLAVGVPFAAVFVLGCLTL